MKGGSKTSQSKVDNASSAGETTLIEVKAVEAITSNTQVEKKELRENKRETSVSDDEGLIEIPDNSVGRAETAFYSSHFFVHSGEYFEGAFFCASSTAVSPHEKNKHFLPTLVDLTTWSMLKL
ncbi:hypothetical protein D8674_005801 [Pyrus ussuriensis x Pyrus communis]|uniref:Uncharacterized protein n=1 Tax=Pyrus ussuriensis x Pyrus communis TaxID=2448454 RepID=A0A5N5G662_9ROSA|nr:hypothetical protein D8674_005801 [Pyrus ussuriensis x Pyrus communis]